MNEPPDARPVPTRPPRTSKAPDDGHEVDRIALLWDIDNVTAGILNDPALGADIVDRCSGSLLLYAAGNRGTYRRHHDMLTQLGITVLSGGWAPQGADHQLLQRGAILASQGVTRFIVASNDGVFARLPTTCAITVLTLTPSLVSQRLLRRAQDIITLARPTH